MKTLLKIIILLLIIIIVGPILIIAYFSSGGPRDLGVKFTEADAQAAYEKNGVQSIALANSAGVKDSLQYQGQKEVNTSFSNAQITGMINSVKWVYKPVTNVQIKINPDGTGEASGILHIDKVLPFISLSHSTDEVEAAIKKYNFGYNPPFYLKGKVSVTNNKVTLNPEKIEIGRITVPQNLISANLAAATTFAQDQLAVVPNLKIRSLTLDGGKVNLDATMPEIERSVQK